LILEVLLHAWKRWDSVRCCLILPVSKYRKILWLKLPEVATAAVNSLPGVWLHRRDRGAVSGCSSASSPNSQSDGDSRCPPESDLRPQNRLPIAALWHRSSLCRSRTAADIRSAGDRYDDGILGTLRILDRAARQDMELPHPGERAPSECPGTDAR